MKPTSTSLPNGYSAFQRPGFNWINITDPTRENLAELKQQYPFMLDIDLRDCLPPFQRPKIVERENYLFLVLLFPVFDESSGTVQASELDVFIGKDFVVTNHDNKLQPLLEAALLAEEPPDEEAAERTHGTVGWLHELLSGLMLGVFPMLTHVTNDVSQLEQELLQDVNGNSVKEILRVKTNIVEMRRIMQGHKHVIEKFMRLASRMLNLNAMNVYYEDLVGHTKEIWDGLQTDRETIEAVSDTYMSRVSYETGEASKTLAALAFVIFPTTLVAAIFAMEGSHMPLAEVPGGWWIELAIVLTTATATMAYLKSRKWL